MDVYRLKELFTQPIATMGKTPISVLTLVQFAVVITVVAVAARMTRRVLGNRVLARTKLDAGLRDAISRIAGYVVLVVGFMIGLQTIGFDLTSLTVVAGAVGVGLGFGMKNIVENFVSGLIILGERPIQLGDRVEVAGSAGEVVRIGARSTTIRTNDNIALIVPNSEFISKSVVNWSHGGRRVRFRIPVVVGTACDVRAVERALVEVAAGNPHALKDPAPSVRFLAFGEKSLTFELRAWTSELHARPKLFISELNFAIWETFRARGIEMPSATGEVRLSSPVQVVFEQSADGHPPTSSAQFQPLTKPSKAAQAESKEEHDL